MHTLYFKTAIHPIAAFKSYFHLAISVIFLVLKTKIKMTWI